MQPFDSWTTARAVRTWLVLVGVLVAVAVLSWPVRDGLSTLVVEPIARVPWLVSTVDVLAEAGLLALVAIAAWLAVTTWRGDRRAFWHLVWGGVGVIAAYGSSEAVKVVVRATRPCQTGELAHVVAACPPAGDYSWPSNHAVLAAAFATAIVLTQPRLVRISLVLTGVVAVARVAGGVHYVHDVASGLAIGTVVTVLVVSAVQHLLTSRPDLAAHLPGLEPVAADRAVDEARLPDVRRCPDAGTPQGRR